MRSVGAGLTALFGRILLSLMCVFEGWVKIGSTSDVSRYMENFGVSPRLLPLVILTELGGGSLIAAGLLTRWAALALAGFCVLTAIVFHRDFGDPDQVIHFLRTLGSRADFSGCWRLGRGAGRSTPCWTAIAPGPGDGNGRGGLPTKSRFPFWTWNPA